MAKVEISTIVDNDAAVAQVTVKVGNRKMIHTGSSKRHPKDRVDKTTGEALAVARALAKAQADIQTYADNRVESSSRTEMFAKVWGESLLGNLKQQTVTFTPFFQGA